MIRGGKLSTGKPAGYDLNHICTWFFSVWKNTGSTNFI